MAGGILRAKQRFGGNNRRHAAADRELRVQKDDALLKRALELVEKPIGYVFTLPW